MPGGSIQPGVNQSVQGQFQQNPNAALNNQNSAYPNGTYPYGAGANQTAIPTNGVSGANHYNSYNSAYGNNGNGYSYTPGGLNNTPVTTNYLPGNNYPGNLPVRPR